ncbi:MAG: dockerin type I repeat-containing protein [Ruminococcus sp.]|nr:dockerin type I repeat-containing protein [Ruminococcus sp.]
MRKFTKEITALLAAATVSSSAGAITGSASEEIVRTAGVPIQSDDYVYEAEARDTGTAVTTTTVPEILSVAGTYTTAKSKSTTTSTTTTTKSVGTYTTQTTTATIPPLAGTFTTAKSKSTTTSTTTTTKSVGTYTTQTTTTTIPPVMGGFPQPDPTGDINLDGKFGIADIVTVQSWILGKKDVEIRYWENADLYPDGRLDVFDICLLKEKLIKDNSINSNYASLEYKITENVENADFSKNKSVSGWMGAKEYYGKGYSPVIDSEGNETKPKNYVTYLVSAYPDYADGGQYITKIEITDPVVMVNGITVNSSFEEFEAVFKAMGYETSITEHSNHVQYNAKNKSGISYIIYVSNDIRKLTIQADVTNREGIQF